MPVIPILIFTAMQAFFVLLLFVIWALMNSGEIEEVMRQIKDARNFPESVLGVMSWAMILSGVATIALCYILRFASIRYAVNFAIVNWKYALIGLFGGILGTVASNAAGELIALPDNLENFFTGMATSVVGALSIGVIGPIVEEYVFRESIIGYMVRRKVNPWVAIISSSLVFGLIHGNPAQIPFAIAMGVLLGMLYYKTGNIIICSILHIINNSIAVFFYWIYGPEANDIKLADMVGGTGMVICLAVVCSALCAAVMWYYWKKHPKTNARSFRLEASAIEVIRTFQK